MDRIWVPSLEDKYYMQIQKKKDKYKLKVVHKSKLFRWRIGEKNEKSCISRQLIWQ